MRAHQLDINRKIINTILVNSLEDFPNLVDASVGGSIGDSITSDGKLFPAPISKPVPSQVTMRQARLALLQAGLLDDVEVAIDAITPESDRVAARIEWDYSSVVERNKGLVAALGASLGLVKEQLDELFYVAGKL